MSKHICMFQSCPNKLLKFSQMLGSTAKESKPIPQMGIIQQLFANLAVLPTVTK